MARITPIVARTGTGDKSGGLGISQHDMPYLQYTT